MDILQQALNITKANMKNILLALDKRKVVYRNTTNDEINYLIPSNMKRKSFDRMVNKNEDLIEEFKNSDKTSVKLK